jgi:phage-related protein
MTLTMGVSKKAKTNASASGTNIVRPKYRLATTTTMAINVNNLEEFVEVGGGTKAPYWEGGRRVHFIFQKALTHERNVEAPYCVVHAKLLAAFTSPEPVYLAHDG